MHKQLNVIKLEATTISDLWFQAIYNLLKHGRKFKIDRGSYAGQTRLEFDYFIGHILRPGDEPILPEIPEHCGIPNPVDRDYVYGGPGYGRSYIEYVMSNVTQPGEDYTYGERLTAVDLPNHTDFNQIEHVIKTYKKYGHRNNQMIMQVANPTDLWILEDPACLRHIDTRIQDNKLHFFVYFRSWELWAGLPANLAGIQALKEYMAGEIGVEDGEMIVESKGLHIYGYSEDLAKMRCMR